MQERPEIEIPPPMDEPPPWVAMWINDFLMSPKVVLMDTKNVGAYLLLLFHSWKSSECSLQNDDKILATLTRLGRSWKSCKDALLDCFFEVDGRLYNERLLQERWAAINKIEQARFAGKMSGKARQIKKIKSDPNYRTSVERPLNIRSTGNERPLNGERTGNEPPHTSQVYIPPINNIKMNWLVIGHNYWICPECGGEVWLHREANYKAPQSYICLDCNKHFSKTEGLEIGE